MFSGCSGLKSLDLSFFDTEELFDGSNAFNGCTALENIKIDNLKTNKAKYIDSMFSYCSSLTSFYLPNLYTLHMDNYGFESMFEGCKNLKLSVYRDKCSNLISSLPSYIEIFNLTNNYLESYIN